MIARKFHQKRAVVMVSVAGCLGVWLAMAVAADSPKPATRIPPLPPKAPDFKVSTNRGPNLPAPAPPGLPKQYDPNEAPPAPPVATPIAPAPYLLPPYSVPTPLRPPEAPVRARPTAAPRITTAPDALKWDGEVKEHQAKAGETTTYFAFSVTNVSSAPVTIYSVKPSCGCTAAKLPPLPWQLAPGGGGPIDLTVDLRGKRGTLQKSVTVESSSGTKILQFAVKIPDVLASGNPDDRAANQQLALTDPQAIFKGDCASCHVEPGRGKHGRELYAASCGICHDADHRASMVPDLHALPHPTDAAYWKKWIEEGKPGTLMPAFSIEKQGPLTQPQVDSLVAFLTSSAFERRAAAAPVGSPSSPSTAPVSGARSAGASGGSKLP